MEEDDDKDDTKRKSRNLSEKKRRDQFNLLVNELSSMVSSNSRKMDKSTVLKSTIAFLKNHNEVAVRSRVHEIQENWKPSFLPNEEFTHLILEALDGFIIVFSTSGKIHYASESITSLLGLFPNDLLNMTIYDMVYEEEQQEIYNILLNPPKTVIDSLQRGISSENQVSFLCHVRRGLLKNSLEISYEYVQFSGYFRDNVDVDNMMSTSRYGSFSGEAFFVGTGRLMTPPWTPQLIRDMSIVDTNSEFTSRHSLEWKCLFLDHRAPPIIGYLPFEVLGTSGYDYYHFDDLDRIVACHEALMQKGEGTSCYYRFLTKGQQWIWLQTRFYITYHQWNSKPEFVVCTHRVVSYADVMRHMKKSDGATIKDVDDIDSTAKDKKALPSTSTLMVMSPWSSKSSRASKTFAHTQESSSLKPKRFSYRPDSDSATSMSADSPLSHHSKLTQNSSVSQRSRSKQNMQISKALSGNQQQQQHPQHHQQQHSHFSQFNLPQTQVSSQHSQTNNQPNSQALSLCPPTLAPRMIPHHQQASDQLVTPFLDQSQYLTAIPVQPVFPATATVISPIQQAPEYSSPGIVFTPTQNRIQDHLQRKHEEIQKLIVQQQEELRRVSEQLFIARYGMLPTAVNVTVPFVTPMDQPECIDISRCISTSSHASSYHDYQPQMIHPSTTSGQQQVNNPQMHIQPPHSTMHPPHVPIQYEMNPQKSNTIENMEADQQNEDIMQYMQLQFQTLQPSNSHQMSQQIQHQQIITHDDFELMPYQMMQQQAQMLFTNDNNSENTNNK